MKYKIVYLEWCDAVGNSDQWRTEEEAIRWAESGEWLVKQSGFIVKETEKYILFASEISESVDGHQVNGLLKIPKTWIRNRKILK